jgi:hypothetical protein
VEILGILHAIGIDRYRSPEDMLSGPTEQKLLRAVKDGVRPVAVGVKAVAKPRVEVDAVPDGLFPDVQRQVDPRFQGLPTSTAAPDPRREPPAKRPPVPKASVEPDVAPSAPSTPSAPTLAPPAPADLSPTLAVLAAEREALESARAALVAERDALRAEREALEADRSRRASAAPSLEVVLERRGLRGLNEFERAIRALAEARRLGEILPYLSVADPVALDEVLRTRLLLVDGQAPPDLKGALVSVAGERAELPGAAEWRRLTSSLSEALLLQGARRVLLVGGPVRMHRLLADALDPRIEVTFRPAHRMTVADAEADVQRTDAIALWTVSSDPESDAVLDAGRASVTRVDKPSVRALLDTWTRDLAEP